MSSMVLHDPHPASEHLIAFSTPLPLRSRLAVLAGKATSAVSRRLLLGRGAVIGGRVTLAVDPLVLTRLTAGRAVTVVSGTNGKTTTTLLLAEALGSTRTVSSTAGANMTAGLVTAAARPTEELVLEVDELFVARTMTTTRPTVLVLLNLSRDQLDRMVEVRRVADRWRAAIAEVTWNMTIVANADDPLVVWAVHRFPDVVWVAGGTRGRREAIQCPSCGQVAIVNAAGMWSCACGSARPSPNWTVDADHLHGPAFISPFNPSLPGEANRSNAAMAVAAAAARGVDRHAAISAVERVESVAGRYLTVPIAGRPVRMLLAKNPASWTEVLHLIDDDLRPIVICVNARGPDGRDTSWLWDVAFEGLAGRLVAACGERRWDLAMRLETAGIRCLVVQDPVDAVRAVAPAGSSVELVGTYSAFHDLLRRLHVRW